MTSGIKLFLLVAAAGAAAMLAGLRCCSETEIGPALDNGSIEDETSIAFSATDQWLSKLKSESRIRFVALESAETDEAQGERLVAEISSLGPLLGSDLQVARSFASSLYAQATKSLREHQASMDPNSVSDAYKEAKLLFGVESALAVDRRLQSSDYIVLPPGQKLPDAVQAEALDVVTMGVPSNGESAVAIFVLTAASDPGLATLKEYQAAARQMHLEDTAMRFNQLSAEERRAAISRHQELHSSDDDWSADDLSFERKWFPSGVRIDSDLVQMVAPPSR